MANNWYTSFRQTSSSTAPSLSTTDQATWSSFQADMGMYWSYKTTEMKMESEVAPSVEDAITTATTSTGTASASDGSTTTRTTASSVSESRNSEVMKLPKNAVEVIVAAITACSTTTPTLTQIATHIHSHVAAYRHQELSILIKMVQHHLHKNTPAYFLPVMSPAGHIFHNPSMARWAINRQAVVVNEDGSIVRRRHRPHTYKHPAPPSSSSSSSSSSSAGPSPSPIVPTPRPAPLVVSPPDGASGTSSPLFQSFPTAPTGYSCEATPYSPLAFLPTGTTMSSGTTMNVYGTTTCTLPMVQPPIETWVYAVPLSRGGVGKMPTARSQASLSSEYSMF